VEPALICQSPFFYQKHKNLSTCKVLSDLECIAAHWLATSNTLTMAEDVSKGQDGSELPPLDNRLVASAAARLDAAKIPNVLWGNYMLTIFGIPTVVNVRVSCQSKLTDSNTCHRALTSLLTMISWALPMTIFKEPVSKSASQTIVSATRDCPMLLPLIPISTSPNPNGWAFIEDPTFCGDSQIYQT
jgi:hypothetical protein